MKRFISVFISLCLMLTMLATGFVTASAEGNTIENSTVTWSFNAETGALHFDGEGSIPDYDDYTDEFGDTSLKYPWKNVEFTSVVFGKGITGIGNYAFAYCDTLKSVEIPDNVTVLGKGIFFQCENLETVKLPANVTEISKSLFSCSGVKNVTFGENTQSIASQAFYKCASLETIVLPASLKTIADEAFSQCPALKSIAIPEGVTEIGKSAFYSCEELAEVTLPSTLEKLGNSAFYGCRKLTSLSVPEKLTIIPYEAFSNCVKLESVTLSEKVTTINDYAFHYCKALKSITIPASVTEIGKKAFGYSKSNATTDGFVVNGYINSVSKAYADEHGLTFNSIGYLTTGTCGETATWEYKEEDKTLYINGAGAIADYTVSALPSYAVIPYEKVVIADTITKIGAYAFYGATAMDFAIAEAVTEIGEKAIGYAADGTLTEGTTITAYPETAAEKYATDNKVKFNMLTPLKGNCGENITWNYDEESKTLTFTGSGAMADYSADAPAIYNKHPYESVVIDENITKIGAYAFYGSSIKDFKISEKVTEIGEKAIGYAIGEDGNEVLVADVSITAYDATAAQSYAEANSIKFNSLGEIPYLCGVCGDNASWTYIKADKTLTIRGTGAIYNYNPKEKLPEFANLEIVSVTIEDGITAIGDYALSTIKPYNTINIGKDVMSIGANAFGFTAEAALGEDGNPTGEFNYVSNTKLIVNGYIVTPADEYSRAYAFTFNALDADKYPEIYFANLAMVDHINNYIFIYSSTPKIAPTMSGFPTDKFTEVSAPEVITTGSKLSLTNENGTYEYTFVVIGDVNPDGTTNSTDALAILKHSVGNKIIENETVLKSTDINHDGKINSTDALIALQASVEKINYTPYYNPGEIR